MEAIMDNDARIIFAASSAPVEVTPALTGKPATLIGYPILWNVLSSDRGGFKYRLMKGSARFDTPTHALFHHNFAAILGVTSNDSLLIYPDDIGVKVEIILPGTGLAHDTAALVAGKYISGMSFAMKNKPTAVVKIENGQRILEATDYLVDEVSVTGIPSFIETTVGILADPSNTPPAAASFAIRRAHSLQANRYRLDLCRMGAEFPQPAA